MPIFEQSSGRQDPIEDREMIVRQYVAVVDVITPYEGLIIRWIEKAGEILEKRRRSMRCQEL